MLIKKKIVREQHFYLSGSYGLGYRLARLPDGLSQLERDYYNKLKRGNYYQLECAYYLDNGFGFGILYNSMNADNKIEHVTVTFQNGITKTGTVSDNITISTFALQGYYRVWQQYRNSCLNMNFGLGYMDYVNDAIVVDPLKITGNTIGLNFGASYFFGLSDGIWIGPYISYNAGLLSEYTTDDGITKTKYELPEDQYEGLHHVDICIKAAITF